MIRTMRKIGGLTVLLAGWTGMLQAAGFHEAGAMGPVWKAADGAYPAAREAAGFHRQDPTVWKAADGAYAALPAVTPLHGAGGTAVLLKANDANQPLRGDTATTHEAGALAAVWKAAGGAYEARPAVEALHTLGLKAAVAKANDKAQPARPVQVETRHSRGADGKVWKGADGAF